LSFFLSAHAYSQADFQEGFIIKTPGDTITGFIDNKGWVSSPTSVTFKNSPDGEAFTYGVQDILRFGVAEKIYISAHVEYDPSPIKEKDLAFEINYENVKDRVFLQVILEGEKSLYYYKDANYKSHFYIHNGNGFDELIYRKSLKRQNGERHIQEDKIYVGQLSLYLDDCPEIKSKLNTTFYNTTSLRDLFHDYYECRAIQYDFTSAKEKPLFVKISVLTGISSTSLNFTTAVVSSSREKYLAMAEFEKSINFMGGMSVDVFLNQKRKKFSLNNEIIFNAYRTSSNFTEYVSDDIYTQFDISFAYSFITLNHLLRFNHSFSERFSLYLNGGISTGITLKKINEMTTTEYVYSAVNYQEGSAVEFVKNQELGLTVGSGISLGRISLEGRYSYGNGMSKVTPLISKTKRLFFLCGYQF